MYLVKALRASSRTRLAFAGAGGKTTTIFTLARQLPSPVFVTSSTHLAVSQLKLADRHLVVSHPLEVERDRLKDWEGVVLFTGAHTDGDRVGGVDARSMAAIRTLADSKGAPLLIEADGSRLRPLKAPADHEPAVPGFVSAVAVVAGLSGLGKPLSSTWVHRPEVFSGLTGIPLGDLMTPDACLALLLHEDGGLKHIPENARRIALLNQVDTEERWAQANGMIEPLLKSYDAVIIASHRSEIEMKQGEGEVLAAHEPIAGVILAAGGSSRMGRSKQLLKWKGKHFVRHVAEKAVDASLDPLVVVTGAESESVGRVLADLPARTVYNPDWELGQSTSVKRGLHTLPDRIGGAVFLLADQPQVPVTLIRNLVESHAGTLAPIVAPRIKGQRGNPVLFDRVTFSSFDQLRGDVGARSLFSKFQTAWVDWEDERPLVDIDTLGDYEALKHRADAESWSW